MRMPVAVTMLTLASACVMSTPITDPIPAHLGKRGLTVEIRDIVRLPKTRGTRRADPDVNPAGWARVSLVRDLPDGRRFANDSRGFLYLIDRNNRPSVYADVAAAFPFAFYNGLEAGFIGFAFHPEFARNGLWYTVHSERAAGNPATAHFLPPGFSATDATYHHVITEWQATNPAADTFDGTRHELLRVAHVVDNFTHPLGSVEFNPSASPGAPDYGLLYTSGSDLGFSNGGGPRANSPGQTQRLDSVVGAILRFDPHRPETRAVKGLGDYTVGATNRFVADSDPETLGEIYAYGFRNAQRLSWDRTDGTMFAADVGMNNIEEINIVHEGANYGWMRREGIFENGVIRVGGALDQLFALPSAVLRGRSKDEFTYPVAMYDHDDGQAVTAGFAYRGRIASLRGKFVFGDIVHGRLFAADLAAIKQADDGIPQTVAPIEEIQLHVCGADGARTVTLRELIEKTLGETVSRADLQISESGDGELLLTSRQDGMIRMLVPESTGVATSRATGSR